MSGASSDALDGDWSREDLEALLSLLSGWATVELIGGLLQRPELLEHLEGGADAGSVARLTHLTERQAQSLLLTLEVASVLEREGHNYLLTSFGRALRPMRGWLELFTRGYGDLFHHSEDVLSGDVQEEWRNVREVGIASARISEHGAFPKLIEIMQRLHPEGNVRVLDYGCANARSLIRLCEIDDRISGTGIEPDPELCEEARRRVAEAGLERRIRIVQALAQEHVDEERADFVIFSFVVQEMLEQMGMDELRSKLAELALRYPTAWFLIVEADESARHDVTRMKADIQLRTYYNYYYYLHDFTRQRLLGFDAWRSIFDRAGFKTMEVQPVDQKADDTGCEAVLVLHPK